MPFSNTIRRYYDEIFSMLDLNDTFFNVNCNLNFDLMYGEGGGGGGGQTFYRSVPKVEPCTLLNENYNNFSLNENQDKVMRVIDKTNSLLRRNHWNS